MLKQRSTKLMCLLIAFVWTTVIIGSSYAYFIDSVQVNGNIITSGNLKAEMQWSDDMQTWHDVRDAETPEDDVIFSGDRWEPNYTEVKYIKIKNTGNLAFQYRLDIVPTLSPTNPGYKLGEVIEAYVDEVGENYEAPTGYKDFEGRDPSGTIASMITSDTGAYYGTLLEAKETITLAVALHMQHTAGNEYQGLSVGDGFNLRLYATQTPFEYDSFGNIYDEGAKSELPENEFAGGSASGTVSVVNGMTTTAVTLSGGAVQAYVPAGVKVNDGVTKLTLAVTVLEESQNGIKARKGESLLAVDVHVDGLSSNNTVPLKITLSEALAAGLNVGNTELYHVENGKKLAMTQVMSDDELAAHNQYYYNPVDGTLTLNMATFSEVAAVSEDAKAWEGKFDYTWYDDSKTELTIANADQLAALGAIVGGMNGQTQDSFAGKTVKLVADVNLGDKESENNPDLIFYPIGYYNSTGSYEKTSGGSVTSSVSFFEGTFDGNGHTIKNFYQNTWEMFGDYNDGYTGTPNHYKDAMGLFGYVVNGTVKNLTVDHFSSDGEYTPTGVIAAYADGNSTFENIAITNCNPRVYNTGNGGIIGIAGDTSAANDDHITLKNITVDNSNKISALWGSWDVACGGLVGMYRGNVDGSGNATGDTISFENCHVSAQIDVYNDVCANYQYYAYRYAGMIIGSVRHNEVKDGKTIPNMTGISASGCTVNYGDWNDYYYCEFEKNTMASYSEDYQFSRVPHSELNFTDSNGNGVVDADERASVTGCKHTHTAEENHQAVYLPFHQLFTGYSWGVSSIGLEQYGGIVTDLDISEGEQQKSVEKFKGKVDTLTNGMPINLGNIFNFVDNGVKLVPDALTVTVTNLDPSNPVSAVFTRDKNNWENGTLFLTGKGAVQITIQDYYFCTPTTIKVDVENIGFIYRVGNQNTVDTKLIAQLLTGEKDYSALTINGEPVSGNTFKFSTTGIVSVEVDEKQYSLEVVDAVNATTAISAKNNNVVLLNDVGLYTIEVSNGYTLYGNGFKMTATSDPMYDTMRAGFVTLDNGTLDNVQIICPNFSYAIIYNSQIKDSANTAVPSDKTNDARGNVRSAVMATGNSKIINSYVHGGRAAIFLRSGDLIVDGSTISGGAAANIHALSAQSLTLRNATLIQKPFKDTVHNTGKTLIGLSGLFECGEDGNSTPLILEGTLIQDAWVNESYKEYVPSAASSIVSTALGKTEYLHDLDGDGTKESLNLGFTYIPQDAGGSTQAVVTDNRTNKDNVPYLTVDVGNVLASAKVYSYKNTNGTSDDFRNVGDYTPTAQGPTPPTVSFTDTNADRVFETTFDSNSSRWESTLTVNLDNGNYTFNFDKLLVQKHGANLGYKVKTADGTEVATRKDISLTSSGVTEYVLTVTDGDVEHTVYFILTASKTSIPDPVVADTTGGTPLLVVKSKNSDWTVGIPALEGIKVKYYTADGEVILDLATLTPTSTGKQNGTNNYWETTKDGYKLKVTCGVIHDTKSVYGMPVVVDNNGTKQMYFTISSTNGYVSTGTAARAVTLTYEFTDPNGKSLTFTKSYNVKYADYKDVAQYSYSDFVDGTLTDLLTSSSGGNSGSCVTPDTLITLANGSKKEIQHVTYEDQLLVWDFYKGEYAAVPSALIVNHGMDDYMIIELMFEDGTKVKAVNAHAFFDADENKFVLIDAENAEEFIGHKFVKNEDSETRTVELVECKVYEDYTESYTLVSAGHYNFMTEGIFSLTNAFHQMQEGLVVGDDLKYDEEVLKADIATYGVYTYEDYADYITEEQFIAFGGPHLKISVGKGYTTYEYTIGLIKEYLK